MAIEHRDGCTIITGPHIRLYQLMALRGAVQLEALGMRRRGRSARATACAQMEWPPRTPAAQVVARLTDVINALETRLRQEEAHD